MSTLDTVGAIQAAETESQLAGVMAHELSHVIMRHATCNLTKQQRKSTWYGLGAIASQILLGNGTAGNPARSGGCRTTATNHAGE